MLLSLYKYSAGSISSEILLIQTGDYGSLLSLLYCTLNLRQIHN